MRTRFLIAAALALWSAPALAQSNAGGSGGGTGGDVTVKNASIPVTFAGGTPFATSLSSLPAFSSPPTVNLGTLNGAALDSSIQALKTALGSPLQAGGAVSVSNFPATQAVSLASLPPLAAGSNSIGVVGITSLPALPAGSNAIGSVSVSSLPALPTGGNTIGNVGVTNFPASQAITAAALPLPSGAATAANQTSEINAVNQRVLTLAPTATNASLAAGAASATTERNSSALANGFGPWQSYRAFARSDQAFSMTVFARTASGGANIVVATASGAANTPVFVSVPVMYPIYITQVVNGGTAATAFMLTDAFSIN